MIKNKKYFIPNFSNNIINYSIVSFIIFRNQLIKKGIKSEYIIWEKCKYQKTFTGTFPLKRN